MFKGSFKKFVTQGVHKYYVGLGNPNAQILFIGKESAISDKENTKEDIEKLKEYNNAETWQSHILNNTCQGLEYIVDSNHDLRKSWGKNTWSKYQILSDYIWIIKSDKFHINFLKYVFTTEINDSPDKKTSLANKNRLDERKKILKDSEFIQSFPVIVLACSNYIKNNNYIREIDEIFNVTYDGDKTGKYEYSKGNWFFVHHNSEKTKLVIHTRQLSTNVDDDLLKEMGEIIKKHLTCERVIRTF